MAVPALRATLRLAPDARGFGSIGRGRP
jgi:hypothetical protein